MSAVVVEDLTMRYRGHTALDGVGLTLEKDTIHGLLGRNGAGKTTLMRILTGQEFESSGRVEVFGQPPRENPAVLSPSSAASRCWPISRSTRWCWWCCAVRRGPC